MWSLMRMVRQPLDRRYVRNDDGRFVVAVVSVVVVPVVGGGVVVGGGGCCGRRERMWRECREM